MPTSTSDSLIVLPMVDYPTCAPLPTVVQPTARQIARCKALADETRLTLLLTLLNAETAVCACNLVPAAGVGQATVSHHLKVLREAGLVAVERGSSAIAVMIRGRRAAAVAAARTLRARTSGV